MITAVSKSALDISYVRKRTALDIEPNLIAGWYRGAKTYGYDEHAAIDFPGDHTIKVEVSVLPFPRGFHDEARIFPHDKQGSGGDENINYQLRESLLNVRVQLLGAYGKLNPALSWSSTETGKVLLEWFNSSIAQRGQTAFELKVRLVFTPPVHAKNQDLRQWRQRYIPDRLG